MRHHWTENFIELPWEEWYALDRYIEEHGGLPDELDGLDGKIFNMLEPDRNLCYLFQVMPELTLDTELWERIDQAFTDAVATAIKDREEREAA